MTASKVEIHELLRGETEITAYGITGKVSVLFLVITPPAIVALNTVLLPTLSSTITGLASPQVSLHLHLGEIAVVILIDAQPGPSNLPTCVLLFLLS